MDDLSQAQQPSMSFGPPTGAPSATMRLPLPPPPGAAVVAPDRPAPPAGRAGELTPGWRRLFGIGWLGVVLGFAAVWKSSWTLGFSTWWLGPQAEPRFPLILVLPLLMPLVAVAGALRGVRYLPFVGIAAGLVTALIGWGDVGRQNGFAIVELALAGGGLAVSLASFAGLLRSVRAE